MLNVVGSLPLLIAYPLAVGMATYRLSRRVRDQNRMLAMLSRTDGLSGLLNRTRGCRSRTSETERAADAIGLASLLMLDIDHFKLINDRHGHPAGDEVIRSVAAILVRATLRAPTPAGRYGGEEFGVVLPDTGSNRRRIIAERIRLRIEAATLEREAKSAARSASASRRRHRTCATRATGSSAPIARCTARKRWAGIGLCDTKPARGWRWHKSNPEHPVPLLERLHQRPASPVPRFQSPASFECSAPCGLVSGM